MKVVISNNENRKQISTNQWFTCNRWKIVARPGLEPRVFRWPCEHSTTELLSRPVISPTTFHLNPTRLHTQIYKVDDIILVIISRLKLQNCVIDLVKHQTHQAYLPARSGRPRTMEKRIPTVMNSWWHVPTAPRIDLGEISARYNEARLTLIPGGRERERL